MKASSFTARLGAEFGIVVLGVFVALWADAWAERRSERETERIRLIALREDVVSTLEDARREVENAEGAIEALRGLMPEATADLEHDELVRRLSYGLTYGLGFHPELSVYEDLKSSGELGLLTDPELRRALSVMDARLERLRLSQEDLTTVQQLNFDSYLLRNLPVRTIVAQYIDFPTGARPLGPSERAALGTREFENVVAFKTDLVVQLSDGLDELIEALEAVRDDIDRQLGDGP
jgi:hypothetical protein